MERPFGDTPFCHIQDIPTPINLSVQARFHPGRDQKSPRFLLCLRLREQHLRQRQGRPSNHPEEPQGNARAAAAAAAEQHRHLHKVHDSRAGGTRHAADAARAENTLAAAGDIAAVAAACTAAGDTEIAVAAAASKPSCHSIAAEQDTHQPPEIASADDAVPASAADDSRRRRIAACAALDPAERARASALVVSSQGHLLRGREVAPAIEIDVFLLVAAEVIGTVSAIASARFSPETAVGQLAQQQPLPPQIEHPCPH